MHLHKHKLDVTHIESLNKSFHLSHVSCDSCQMSTPSVPCAMLCEGLALVMLTLPEITFFFKKKHLFSLFFMRIGIG